MRISIRVAVLLFLAAAVPGRAETIAEHFPGTVWDEVDPAAAGWSADRLKEAESWSQKIGTTALIVVHRGRVVAQWGDIAAKTPLASVRKSLLSALYGNAVERGDINLNQTMGQLGIDDNEPSLSPEEKTATVRDLLQARSGIYHAALYETPGMAAKRPSRFSRKPGTFWYYNNWDFNTLGAIYEHAVRSSIFDVFDREIARPIGMEDYRPADGAYVTGAASVYPAYPVNMSARDLARFALLYLHTGKWQDHQVVPAHWVAESTRPYSHDPRGPGYGYLWWTGFLGDDIAPSVNLPVGTFAAWGAGGQYAYVMPDYDLVVVHRAAHRPDQGPSLRDFGRLLWLVLDAGHFSDIGPDASITAMHGRRLDAFALNEFLPGKPLISGEPASDGPFRIRLNPDGTTALLGGRDRVQIDTGTWQVSGDRLCREWEKTPPRRLCWSVAVDDHRIALFDGNGVMFIDARLDAD